MQYVKGAVEVCIVSEVNLNRLTVSQSAIGSVTGATEWQKSATSDKQAGIDAMKQASAQRDPQQQGFGKVEEIAGKVSGCEGMQEEGKNSAAQRS